MEEIILYFSLKYNGDFMHIYDALVQKEKVDEKLKEELFGRLKCSYTTIFNDDYPSALKDINCPPFVLYYYGDLSLVNNNVIAMVGMRECSEYGKNMALLFSSELANEGYTIVSGMAMGIDTYAHIGAIQAKGHTIAVLGSGIDYCYPRRNMELYELVKDKHLILSEYPFDRVPDKNTFPFRNRIVAGLAQSVVVVEAKRKSGTMITVGYALEQGKDVYAIPSQINGNDGCNYLIQQGAKLIMNVKDIIEEQYMC